MIRHLRLTPSDTSCCMKSIELMRVSSFSLLSATRSIFSLSSTTAFAFFRSPSTYLRFCGKPAEYISVVRSTHGLAASVSEALASAMELPDLAINAQISDSTVSTMPSADPKLAFIGAGMMATAMINGIITAKVCKLLRLYLNWRTIA